jgi:hypothetical protein
MGQILSILWEILSILWEICYIIGIFRNHSPPPPPPVDNNFGKFVRKIFFDNSGTIRKISFRPPNFFLPVHAHAVNEQTLKHNVHICKFLFSKQTKAYHIWHLLRNQVLQTVLIFEMQVLCKKIKNLLFMAKHYCYK